MFGADELNKKTIETNDATWEGKVAMLKIDKYTSKMTVTAGRRVK